MTISSTYQTSIHCKFIYKHRYHMSFHIDKLKRPKISHTKLFNLYLNIYFSLFRSSEPKSEMMITFSPLTKESKLRRHIRSMSDVQSSTPYRIAFRSRVGSIHTLMYDSDTRARRIRSHHRHREPDSSDSSDYFEPAKKVRSLGHNIIKHTDSMRIL